MTLPQYPTATDQLVAVSGDGQSAPIGTALPQPLAVRAQDRFGDPIAGTVVQFTIESGSGSLTAEVVTTDATGIAATRWTVGTLGTNTLTAQVISDATGSSVGFTATGLPPNIVFGGVTAGALSACGVSTSGAAYCWGFNGDGELGTGLLANASTPTDVTGGLTFRTLAAGRYHTCGIAASGQLFCWGANSDGRLGTGNTTNTNEPTAVETSRLFSRVAAGLVSTCGLDSGGMVFCWGSDQDGELGVGGLPEGFSSEPVQVVALSGIAVQTLGAGAQHNCALTVTAQLYCWGYNATGQIGVGTTINATTPVEVLSPDALGFSAVTGGSQHTCALNSAGAAYCWGSNAKQQLGIGSTDPGALCADPGLGTVQCATLPIAVEGGLTFQSIAAGSTYTCGLSLTGLAYCWGDNAYGQLGDGTTTTRSTPTPVAGGLSFQSITAGERSTCGVTTAGVAYCWGDNTFGQLGTGAGSSLAPAKVARQS